jgi:hypothetical protein
MSCRSSETHCRSQRMAGPVPGRCRCLPCSCVATTDAHKGCPPLPPTTSLAPMPACAADAATQWQPGHTAHVRFSAAQPQHRGRRLPQLLVQGRRALQLQADASTYCDQAGEPAYAALCQQGCRVASTCMWTLWAWVGCADALLGAVFDSPPSPALPASRCCLPHLHCLLLLLLLLQAALGCFPPRPLVRSPGAARAWASCHAARSATLLQATAPAQSALHATPPPRPGTCRHQAPAANQQVRCALCLVGCVRAACARPRSCCCVLCSAAPDGTVVLPMRKPTVPQSGNAEAP